VYWLWLNVWLSLRLGWSDMLKLRDHLLIGIVVALASVALSYIATGSAGALYVLLAWPAALVAIYAFFAVRRLTGWDGLFEHGWRIVALPDGGRQVTATLTPKQGPRQWLVPPEISCVLRPLAGHEIGPFVTPYPGIPSVLFPEEDPMLAAGAYAVIWKEQKPPGTGKRRVIAYYRCTVPPASSDGSAAGSEA
jgi:hypothetical protein